MTSIRESELERETNLSEIDHAVRSEINALLSRPIPLGDEERAEERQIARERGSEVRERIVDQGGTIDHRLVDLRQRIDLEHREVLPEERIRAGDSIESEENIR